MKFADLGLSPETLQAIEEVGYDTPTPIQEKAIPPVLMGRDVLGIAQTGTGKTAGFTLPMIEILSNGRAKARMPRSLILAPTRELAAQVAENFTLYGKYHKLDMALLIGGESMGEQMRALDKGVDVLIATPGRLLDLFERGKILLRDVKVLVIDEADRMLDMGFIPDVERITTLLPPLRQTLFFSATMDKEIRKLADAFLSNPREISIERKATAAETVTQRLAMVPRIDKREALRHILRTEGVRNAFIFCNRKRDVDVLNRSLRKHDFNCISLHGDMDQPTRNEMLRRFKDGEADLLVCSDVAARGLDIDDVSHVINFDIPTHPEDYVHRIGRTGRAGKDGAAFSLATPDDAKLLAAIESMLGRTIPRMELEGLDAPATGEDATDRRADSGRRGGRDRDRRGARDRRTGRERDRSEATTAPASTRGASESRDRTDRIDRTDRTDRLDRASRQRRGRRRDEIPAMSHADDVVGFGDYMPAFFADNALVPMGRGGEDTATEGEDGDEAEAPRGRRKSADTKSAGKERKSTAKPRARSKAKAKDADKGTDASQEPGKTRKRHGRRGAAPEEGTEETPQETVGDSPDTPTDGAPDGAPGDTPPGGAEAEATSSADDTAPPKKPRRATRRRKTAPKTEDAGDATTDAGDTSAGNGAAPDTSADPKADPKADPTGDAEVAPAPKRRARRVRRPKGEAAADTAAKAEAESSGDGDAPVPDPAPEPPASESPQEADTVDSPPLGAASPEHATPDAPVETSGPADGAAPDGGTTPTPEEESRRASADPDDTPAAVQDDPAPDPHPAG
ncbi:DEAD/DEAH box helicase [Roseospira visakhapatnamensis]|uniref:DEAD-box ATP-dependent RNA helicase RhpA n=1 Tax=Roseospira visakhapatnamensis TaxID=390880 RepID=A0A7W6RA12_9PROT|nr:superfamily II DNA/RNA helicase [Roseospira visakhapatnamensis]